MMRKSLPENTDNDKIIAYLQDTEGEVNLNAKLEEKLERLHHTDNLIYQYGQRKTVVDMLIKKYGYSYSTAYRDYQDAQLVFGSIGKVEKEYWKHFAMEQIIRGIKMALKKKDVKNLIAACKELRRTVGYDEDDIDLPDFSEVQPVDIIVGFFPDILKTPLPPEEELEEELKRLVKTKRKKDISLDDIEEAKEVD